MVWARVGQNGKVMKVPLRIFGILWECMLPVGLTELRCFVRDSSVPFYGSVPPSNSRAGSIIVMISFRFIQFLPNMWTSDARFQLCLDSDSKLHSLRQVELHLQLCNSTHWMLTIKALFWFRFQQKVWFQFWFQFQSKVESELSITDVNWTFADSP